MTQLTKIKRRLGISDDLQDDLIRDLVEDTESHFKLLTGADMVAPKYEFIIREVAIKRYNRKGSEGATSESTDGYSVSYADGASDFAEYMDIIGLNDSRRGKVKFL